MPDEFFSRTARPPQRPPARGGGLRAAIGLVLLAAVVGGGALALLAWRGTLPASGPAWSALSDHAPLAAASPAAPPPAKPQPQDPARVAALTAEVTALETRLNRIDAAAGRAAAEAAGADRMLLALAARHAIERGAAPGAWAARLPAAFAGVPAAADVAAAGPHPPTLDQLYSGLDALDRAARPGGAEPGRWAGLRRQLAALFVLRRGAERAPDAPGMVARATGLLRAGEIDAAAEAIASLPPSPANRAWVADARRYAALHRALDALDTAALSAAAPPPAAAPRPAPPPAANAASGGAQ